MSFRTFVICFAGLLSNVWILLAVRTPIVSTGYDLSGAHAPRAAGLIPAPERSTRVPIRGVARALSSCFVFDAGGIIGLWNPTIPEAASADSAFADFLLEMVEHGLPAKPDSTVRAMQNDARQVIGVDRFVQGRGYLIIGYEPDGGRVDRVVTQCTDPRWRWSVEYTPGAGLHHFSLFRDTCEDPETPAPSPERTPP